MMNNTALSAWWSSKRALSIGSGILLALSYPPLPFPFLLFPAWILLFRLAEIAESKREAACWGYLSFVIWNLGTTYWLMMATLAGGIAAILANAVVMTLPFVLQYHFQKKLRSPWLIALLHAAAWVGFEYLHHLWDLAWPWLTLGNAWSDAPGLVQYISATGYWSISAWVLIVASLAWQTTRSGGSRSRFGYTAIFLGFLMPIFSLVLYYTSAYESDRHIEAAVVQPNFDTYLRYGGYGSIENSQKQLYRLTDSVITDQTDLILWPENAVRTPLSSEGAGSGIQAQLEQRANAWNATLITGTTYFDYFRQDSLPPLARSPERAPHLYYNAALGFFPQLPYRVYRKHNLVPIVERVPFVHFLDAIDIFGLVDWKSIQGYGQGKEATLFPVDGTSTPALVCYDSVFPGWVRSYVEQGAGFISIITNDGWWGNTSGHYQHFSYARLRAIEFRRWIVRSANNGISGIITPHGDVALETRYWEQDAFRYRVPVLNRQTLYARWGDWFPITMLLLTGAGLIVTAIYGRNRI